MTVKASYTADTLAVEQTERMQFRIPGLRMVGEDTFEIEAKPLHLDCGAIEQLLDAAGIEREDTTMYAERFYTLVQIGELSKFLAKRMERVG